MAAATTYTNYKLVWGIGGDALEEEVRENILLGYQPLGPPIAAYDPHKSYWACAQAMVIDGPETPPAQVAATKAKIAKEKEVEKAKEEAAAAKAAEAKAEAERKAEIEATAAKKAEEAKAKAEAAKAKEPAKPEPAKKGVWR
jgi:hypothetical protein